jgi:hypothetical protein
VTLDRLRGYWERVAVSRRQEAERPVRALEVVVGCVGAEGVFEVAVAEDQEPVEAFGADGADEFFGVGVRLWRPNRRVDHSDAFAAEDLVEGCREFAVAVVDQEPRPLRGSAGRSTRARLRRW